MSSAASTQLRTYPQRTSPCTRPWLTRLLLAAVICLVSVPPAVAVILPPGEVITLSGARLSDRPELAQGVFGQHMVPFELLGEDLTPRLQGSVEVALSLYGGTGRLVQHYRIADFQDLEGAGFRIDALATAKIYNGISLGLPLDVDFLLDSPGETAPSWAFQVWEADSILFGFEPALQAGQSSRTMFVVTADDLHSFGGYGAHVRVVDGLGQVYELPFDS